MTASDPLTEIRRLQSLLADCYRLSGADPDGNEDWRLADGAVEAVKELLANYDEACQEAHDQRNDILMAVNDALDEAHAGLSIARGTIDGKDFYQVVKDPVVRYGRP